jgi:hypothetical protein
MIEVLPTFQVVGDLRFASRSEAARRTEMTIGADNA